MRSLSLCCRRRWSPTSGVIAPLPSPLHRCSSKSAHVPLTSPTRSAYPVLQLSSSYPFLQLSPSYVRPAVRQQPYVAIVSAQQNATRPNMASSANGFGSSAGRPPYTVFIEGNVGSGKTTFLEHFASCPNVFLAREPVHVWQDVRGHNFLVSSDAAFLPAVPRFDPLTCVLLNPLFFSRASCTRTRSAGALRSSPSCREPFWNCTRPDRNADKTSKSWNGPSTVPGDH